MQDYNERVYDDDLTNLEDWLRRLKVEYDVYFNGHRKKPPEDLKSRVEKLVKRLSEAQNMSCQDRFRYNTLIARYYVYRDRWRRIMMAREQSDEAQAKAPAARHSPSSAARVSVSIADGATQPGRIRELYDAMLVMQEKYATGWHVVSYPHFATYIAAKTQIIRAKFGCPSVLFTISQDEDAIRFTATAETPK